MLTPSIRDFLVQLDELLDRCGWPALDREVVSVTPGDAAMLVRLPHSGHHERDIELEVDDHAVTVHYSPEQIVFTSRSEALTFIEMLGQGRVDVEVHRGLLWTTMTSHLDGQVQPFRRTRMPWATVRPRVETRRFGFTN